MIPVASASYAAAALGFVLLAVLFLTSWRGRRLGAELLAACTLTAVWAGAQAFDAWRAGAPRLPAELLEILRDGAWLYFLLRLLALRGRPGGGGRTHYGLLALACAALAGLIAAAQLWPAAGTAFAAIVGRALLAVAGLALVEQFYRNTPPDQRWGVKFLCLGVGGVFAYDFFLYTDAMLFRQVDDEVWAARGVANLFVVPLLAISAARNPQWSLDVFVSRRVVFHTATLIGAGIYLLAMAAAGYYIRVFGGEWGGVLQAAFLFGALLVLLSVIFSGTARARLRVFLSKNFFNYQYDYRDQWLRFTQSLARGPVGSRVGERAIQAVAELVDSTAGALWMRTDAGFRRAGHWNMSQAAGEEAVDGPLARFLAERHWVISLDECRRHPERYGGLTLPAWLEGLPQAWLIVPLVFHEELIGFIVLARSLGRVRFNWEVSDLLKTAARQAAATLAQAQAADALIVARQFESFNRMAAFVVHDLKNLVAQLSLVLANAEKYKHNPEFQDDMLETVANSVSKMNRLLTQLRSRRDGDGWVTEIEVADLLSEVVRAKGPYRVQPRLDAAPGLVVRAERERLARVIGHLVQNAVEATPAGGEVALLARGQDGGVAVEVRDTGCGMDEGFLREQLFRPFATTKATGMGIGVYESREYVHSLGGRLEVESAPDRGSTFRVWLPLKDRPAVPKEAVNLEALT